MFSPLPPGEGGAKRRVRVQEGEAAALRWTLTLLLSARRGFNY
jgi:hypothetical protein